MLDQPLRLKVSGGSEIYKVGRPSEEKYETFVRELAQLSNDLQSGKDFLEASVEALRSVILYLQGDRAVIVSGACQPFINLLSSTNDLLHGADPPLFAKKRHPKGGAPTNLEAYRARAYYVLIVDLLLESGAQQTEVIRVLADDLSKEKILNPRTRVPWTERELSALVKKVRDHTAPLTVIQFYEQLTRARIDGSIRASVNTDDAREAARKLVRAVALNMSNATNSDEDNEIKDR